MACGLKEEAPEAGQDPVLEFLEPTGSVKLWPACTELVPMPAVEDYGVSFKAHFGMHSPISRLIREEAMAV